MEQSRLQQGSVEDLRGHEGVIFADPEDAPELILSIIPHVDNSGIHAGEEFTSNSDRCSDYPDSNLISLLT